MFRLFPEVLSPFFFRKIDGLLQQAAHSLAQRQPFKGKALGTRLAQRLQSVWSAPRMAKGKVIIAMQVTILVSNKARRQAMVCTDVRVKRRYF